MSSHCFLEGANIHHYAFVEGAIILPCQLLVGQMSTHAIFHRGADVRGGGGGGGGNVRLPKMWYVLHSSSLTVFQLLSNTPMAG